MKKNSKSFCKPKFSGLSVIAFLGLIISFLCSAYGNVYKSKINAQWSKDNSHFWYRNDLPKGEREFIFVDVKKGDRRLAFDHQKLAESSEMLLKKQRQFHQSFQLNDLVLMKKTIKFMFKHRAVLLSV